MVPSGLKMVARVVAVAGAASVASAQLRPRDVLVVYHSGVPDSLAVAEYYAGSAAVGGTNGLTPKRFGVRTFDLASAGVAASSLTPNVSRATFQSAIRTPIRNHLTGQGLVLGVRCIVLTKGLPHRIQDFDQGLIGDNPNNLATEWQTGDADCASVDAELTLLWQNHDATENGNAGDSRADGLIPNPFWQSTTRHNAFSNANIQTAKVFRRPSGTAGIHWLNDSPGTQGLGPGEVVLVTRLDGKTVADVRGSIDRAQRIYLNTNQAAVVLDASSDNTVEDTTPNAEFDNQDYTGRFWSGDDYEKTRNFLQADKRLNPANVFYNAFGGAAVHFLVGPRIAYTPAGGLVSNPVILLGSYGSNQGAQSWQPTAAGGINAGQNYADSFNYADGAIFNTIESYNARDFGGIGGWTGGFGPQEQLSDFIAAGGTLGIGMVWEPLAFSVPDNEWLVKNFILGQMSWAEAAWSSIPVLSWMHVVVGDPLAHVIRSGEDIDSNGTIDAEDLIAWTRSPVDINRDGVANAADYAFIEASARRLEAITLPGQP